MTKTQPSVILYHSPWSRSVSIRWLLEELGVPYVVEYVDVHATGGAPEAYRSIQPHKKVPAVQYAGRVITERAAITIYLADAFSESALAPAWNDADRAEYLTMLVYCDSVFDPCVAARMHGLNPAPADYSFGSFDDLIQNLERRLQAAPYAAGNRFTAADTQLGSALHFTMNILRAVPRRPVFDAYLERVRSRPACQRAQALDAELLRRHPEIGARAAVAAAATN